MIIDVHQQGGRRSLLPCVVAEGLSQGMTAYIVIQSHGPGGFLNDPESLTAAEGPVYAFAAGEQAGIFRKVG